jgi:hypothetical protein
MPPKKPLHPYRTIHDGVLLSDIAVDTTGTYITGFPYDEGPRLWVCEPDTDAARALVEEDGPPLSHVRAGEGGVFVVAEQVILRVDRASGARTPIAETPVAMTTSLALDGAWVYGTVIGANGGVYRVPTSGGTLDWIFRGPASSVVAHDGRVAWATEGALMLRAAEGEALRRVDAPNPKCPCFFGSDLLWAEWGEAGRLAALDLTTGEQRTVTPATYPGELTTTGRHIYWTQALTKPSQIWIWRMDPADPGSVQGLVKGRSKGGRLAAGAGALVWIDDCAGGAHRMELSALGPE